MKTDECTKMNGNYLCKTYDILFIYYNISTNQRPRIMRAKNEAKTIITFTTGTREETLR